MKFKTPQSLDCVPCIPKPVGYEKPTMLCARTQPLRRTTPLRRSQRAESLSLRSVIDLRLQITSASSTMAMRERIDRRSHLNDNEWVYICDIRMLRLLIHRTALHENSHFSQLILHCSINHNSRTSKNMYKRQPITAYVQKIGQ